MDRIGKLGRPQAKLCSEVNGNFATKDGNMIAYLKLVLDIIPHFERFELTQVPHLENAHADALSKLASNMDSELLNVIPIEHLSKPSTSEGEEILWIEGTPLWMQPIIAYLKEQTLPASRGEARKLRRRDTHFLLQEDTLYKRGFASPLLRCVGVSDNGRQFDNRKMLDLCDELGIKKDFSTPHHTQVNGKVEAVNKTIKHTLKMKLDTSKGAWVDELPHVLWAIRTSCRTAIGETPFSMTYGAEAMSLDEVGVPSH
ncbi:uncharacterized protein LOC111404695 [Olea europaea var. sylvestris]|uniref:uncharacterized protein LOC111404695 n=1 Tax=Olea europaea var. sylvestris TaxID=158386 RepID=UPI000C1D77CA|nr:uncharacterized protein LOC111404695 [Olea europaea var. sylvestris]